MDSKQVPLSVMMESAKGKLTAAFSQVAQETHLPAYLLEGIVAGILADIRSQKSIEIVNDYTKMNSPKETESEDRKDG
jgi:hypothetical protein